VNISHTASVAKVYFRSALHTGTHTVAPSAVKLHVLLVFAGNTCGFIITSSKPSHQMILVRPWPFPGCWGKKKTVRCCHLSLSSRVTLWL